MEPKGLGELIDQRIALAIATLTGGKSLQELLGDIVEAAATRAKELARSEIEATVRAAQAQAQVGPGQAAGADGRTPSPFVAALKADPVALIGKTADEVIKVMVAAQGLVNPLSQLEKIAQTHPILMSLYAPNPWGSEMQRMLAKTYEMGMRTQARAKAQGVAPFNPFPSSSGEPEGSAAEGGAEQPRSRTPPSPARRSLSDLGVP